MELTQSPSITWKIVLTATLLLHLLAVFFCDISSVTSIHIFAGGTDTSSITVEWALAELISHPSKMKRVQDEIDEVVGNSRLVEQDDVQNMPYFQAVIKETMRLHPECRIEDFDIPANALTFINVWAIGRDENVWENPLDFSPERFLGSDFDIRGRHFELLPFGSGRLLACLVQAFDFEPDERGTCMTVSELPITGI
ncbi:hypothetical protein KP509_01G034400 [Ceratopteris richardii]|uniref:Cytochrome P450 n=1 Tax=Ceratopteris richardii TaxID=49495 RepID=A0A8T2VG15_CERRI|nr:hypothetical protein KP509_01G034400 [Ceratopteris richardii]